VKKGLLLLSILLSALASKAQVYLLSCNFFLSKNKLVALVQFLKIITLFVIPLSTFSQLKSFRNLPSELQNELLAFYPLNGDAGDSSGNNFHGISNLTVGSQDRYNNLNSSIYFNGTGCNYTGQPPGPSSIAFSFNNQNFTKGFTVAAWAKRQGPGCEVPPILSFGLSDRGKMNWLWSNNMGPRILYTTDNNFQINFDLANTNDWTFIAIVNDGSIIKIFQDGNLMSQSQISNNPMLGNSAQIGKLMAPTGGFNGFVDDLFIYSKALTNEQVQLLYSSSGGVSPSYVSGVISADTVWRKVNSPYIVTNNLLVQRGVKLTIEPGVEVRFDASKYLKVEGDIIARGSSTDSIYFRANTSSGGRGYWNNIWLLKTSSSFDSVSNSYNSGSAFSYCVFTNAREGIRLDSSVIQVDRSSFYSNTIGVNFRVASLSLFYKNVFKFNGEGVSTSAGTENNGIGSFTGIRFIENLFEYNGSGLSLGGYRNNSTNNIIRGNIVRHNSGVGLNFQWGDVTRGFYNSIIASNIVYKNGASGIVIGRDKNIIRRNIILENGSDGIEISGTYIYEGLIIENNIVSKNGRRAIDLSSNNNSVIRYNSIISSGISGTRPPIISSPSIDIPSSYISSANNTI
jgi:hypothetical protein